MDSQKEACKDFILASIRFIRNRRKFDSGRPVGVSFRRIHLVVAASRCPMKDYWAACIELVAQQTIIVVGKVKSPAGVLGSEKVIRRLPEGYTFLRGRFYVGRENRLLESMEEVVPAIEKGECTAYSEVRIYIAADGLPVHLEKLIS